MSRPYLEVKVVPVKKGKKNNKCEHEYGLFRCLKCGKVLEKWIPTGSTTPKKNGNWVNGENLDKIKFPCFCSYVSFTGKKHHALLIKDRNNGEYKYKLLRISQDNGESIFLSSDSLKKLIRKWDIHILKAKIILFEEKNK